MKEKQTILAELRAKEAEKKELAKKRAELAAILNGHRDRTAPDYGERMTEINQTIEQLFDATEAYNELRSQASTFEILEQVRKMPTAGTNDPDMRTQKLSSEHYRNAFFRSLMSNRMAKEDEEIMAYGKRMEETGQQRGVYDGGGVTGGQYLIPLTTQNKINGILEQYGRVWGKITRYGFMGTISLPIGTAETEEKDGNILRLKYTFTETKIDQTEIIATIEVKNITLKNSIPAFEAFLVQEIGKYIGTHCDMYVLNGKEGDTAFEGLLPAVTPKTYTEFTYSEICAMQGDLDSPYGDQAVFICKRKTFFNAIKNLTDVHGAPISTALPLVTKMGTTYYLDGHEVVFTNAMADGEIAFADLPEVYVANVSQDTVIERDESEKFSYDKTMFRGKLYAGGKPISAAIAKAGCTLRKKATT